MDGASVVICARNAEGSLAAQLSAVLAQETEFEFEVVVVDNGSTDGTASIVALAAQLDRRVLPVYESEPGQNVARNAGVRSASHDRILMCDADDTVEAGWIQAMARALDGRVYAGGARIRGGLNTPKELDLLGIVHLETTIRCSTKLGVPTPGGANCAFRKTMWDEVGGFDPGIRLALDEEEFFARAHLAGWRMVEVPDAVIQYFVPAEPMDAFRKGYRYGRDVEEARARFRSSRATGKTTSLGENDEVGGPVAATATRVSRARQRWASIIRESPRVAVSQSGRSDWTRRLGSELGHIVGDSRVRLESYRRLPSGGDGG